MRRFGEPYVRGRGMATRNNGLAHGYSITATASFGVLYRSAAPATVGRMFLFVLGTGIAFAVVNALVTPGFRRRVERAPPVVMALATSFALSPRAPGSASPLGWPGG